MNIPMRMVLAIAAMMVTLPGCSSIYFYETEKIGLVLEVRPDATAPLTGTLGAKRRVVALVPSTDGKEGRTSPDTEHAALTKLAAASRAYKTTPNEDNKKELHSATLNYDLVRRGPDGDAMSLLNTFRFHKKPEPGFGRIEIDTALITGLAAIDVAKQPENSLDALKAMTGDAQGLGLRRLGIDALIASLQQAPAGTPGQAKYAAANAAAGRILDRILDNGTHPITIYAASRPNLIVTAQPGTPLTRTSGWTDLNTYMAALEASVDALRASNLAPPAGMTQAMLKADLKRSTETLAALRRQLGTDSDIAAAVHHALRGS